MNIIGAVAGTIDQGINEGTVDQEVEDRGVSAREPHHTGLTGPAPGWDPTWTSIGTSMSAESCKGKFQIGKPRSSYVSN